MARNSAVRPKAAAAMWTRKPTATPHSEMMPAMRPWQIERDTQ
jgi:hypothetical protein